ncbi:hypothetical protein F5144DRAFT_610515 [Chaetomium tenue]|uniref:Uncharacterized protein n=1 Tax=Chaetomium tenue TaxID=1854479 RepID=A0ACB7PL84_9PEZI|nr:hypothetical protein F5144DRAFT_610515 [Chaetomium globosum]
MSYFETIIDISAFEARRKAEANSRDISKWKKIPPADKWSAAELHAARLVVRSKGTESSHMLPALRRESDRAKEAHNQEQIRALLKGPQRPWGQHTRTELAHLYGDGPGYLWALLARFPRHDADHNNPPAGHVTIPFHPDLATFEVASLFPWHVAWACPPQDDTRHFKPEHLVQYRSRRRADFRDRTRCPALVAAKKRFDEVRDGLPVLTDSVLGQLTCEALALRLELAQKGGHGEDDENVFMIVAARQYMRFLQFKISDAYIAELVAEGGKKDMTGFVELWATPWFSLKNEAGRRKAVDNIAALIIGQPWNM